MLATIFYYIFINVVKLAFLKSMPYSSNEVTFILSIPDPTNILYLPYQKKWISTTSKRSS